MKTPSIVAAIAVAALSLTAAPASASASASAVSSQVSVGAVVTKAPAKWKNCTAVNKTYKHGVGKKNAKDKTSGKRVTNFKKSDSLYKEAMKYNKGLDRDKDGIACEKR